MMQNLKGSWLANSKLTWRIWQILTQALENLKDLQFNGLLLTKVNNVWAKKVQRSYVWRHWKLMQNSKENWVVLPKMTWEISQIFTTALKSLKMGLLWDLFIQSRRCMSIKFTGELCVTTMKNDAKFEEELTCRFKIATRKLMNFDLSTQKSQKSCTLMGCFWSKYIIFELRK